MDWQRNYFEFEAAALNYRHPEYNRYRYKLEGVDHQWFDSGKLRRGRYTGLAPGQYTLKIQGSNNDGVWSDKIAELKVIVTPPFWVTWWFRGLMAAMVVGVMLGTFRWRVRAIETNRRQLEIQVAERTNELKQEIGERKQAEEQVKASLKEKEVLLSEIHHRVKNNMQTIISLLKLQSDKIKDKQYIDMFQDSQDRITTMSLVHEQLYQTKDFANIDFGEHVESLVNGLFGSYGIDTNKIKLNIEIKDVSIDLENAIPCGLIINELVSNSLKYAFPQAREGKISIALRPFNEDGLELTVSDDGIGFPEDLDIKDTDTMGLQLVKMLSENQLDGKIDLDRTGGTQFNIKFKRTA